MATMTNLPSLYQEIIVDLEDYQENFTSTDATKRLELQLSSAKVHRDFSAKSILAFNLGFVLNALITSKTTVLI